MTTHVVVPTWSRLAPDIEAETGCKYAAFIHLAGRPLYKLLIDQFKKLSPQSKLTFIVAPDALQFETENWQDIGVCATTLEQSTSIGETVLAGLSNIVVGDSIVVNMADTLVKLGAPLEVNTIYTQLRSDLYRWTSVAKTEQGAVNFPHDRDNFEHLGAAQEVCVGLFTFDDAVLFRDHLKSAIASDHHGQDPFFHAISLYSQVVPLTLTPASEWFDCGSVDTYYESRLGYQNLRHFNSLTYEPLKGQVTKTSTRVEQYRHQVRWFKQVPDELAAFLPRIFSSSDGPEPFITMELLSIPTLGEVFVTERLKPGAWNGVVRTIAYIQSEFAKYSYRTPLAAPLARSVYLDKTKTRLGDFIIQDERAFEYFVKAFGKRIDLTYVLDSLDDFVESTGLLAIESLSPIHGDFCFSNLLFDPKVRVVKMIDPRGEFGVPGIYGDPRYDLAKLAHSYAGGYDFIVADRFSVAARQDGEIDFSNGMGAYHKQVKLIFELILLADPLLRRQVFAIQALLFLSMLPLHVDAPRRQLAMLSMGLNLYAKASELGGYK